MNKKNNNALILFIKAPGLGRVKTRLQPELTPEQALSLYRAMVEDIVRQLDAAGFWDLKIFFTPADSRGAIKNWLGDQFEYFPQHGDDLGEKMNNAIAEMQKQKYQKAVLIGSDIPTLDATTIVRAFRHLDECDVVIGPSKDGGYYLIGMKRPCAELFQDISWSSNLVLNQTIQKARASALEIVQMEQQSDIDTYADVVEFWAFLKKQNMTGALSFKSKTSEVLKRFFEIDRVDYH